MNDIQNILYNAKWVRSIVESTVYTAALKLLAHNIIPERYRNEMKQTAKEAGVPYVSVLAINLSYELYLLARTSPCRDLYQGRGIFAPGH